MMYLVIVTVIVLLITPIVLWLGVRPKKTHIYAFTLFADSGEENDVLVYVNSSKKFTPQEIENKKKEIINTIDSAENFSEVGVSYLGYKTDKV